MRSNENALEKPARLVRMFDIKGSWSCELKVKTVELLYTTSSYTSGVGQHIHNYLI